VSRSIEKKTKVDISMNRKTETQQEPAGCLAVVLKLIINNFGYNSPRYPS
jgi:hypothetical protein